MYFSQITTPDINNGLGFRVTLWVSGCSHFCHNCHNYELSDPKYGREFGESDFDYLIQELNRPYIKGLTLSGGDPLFDKNRSDINDIITKVKETIPHKDIWLYTGYYLSDLIKMNNDIINNILKSVDVIIDGPYIESKKDLSIPFRGSSNQTIFKKSPDDFKFYKWIS